MSSIASDYLSPNWPIKSGIFFEQEMGNTLCSHSGVKGVQLMIDVFPSLAMQEV